MNRYEATIAEDKDASEFVKQIIATAEKHLQGGYIKVRRDPYPIQDGTIKGIEIAKQRDENSSDNCRLNASKMRTTRF